VILQRLQDMVSPEGCQEKEGGIFTFFQTPLPLGFFWK
jgi:hypothetical protein